MSEPLIHLHIPKTAGTSLRRSLIDSFGAENVYYYDASQERCIRSSLRITASERDAVDRAKSDIHAHRLFRVAKPLFQIVKRGERVLSINPARLAVRNFAVLSGHFTGGDLQSWGLDQQPVVTVVRDPMDRMWSQFRHWQRTRGLAFNRADSPFDPGVSFADYAMQPHLANFQSRLLDDCVVRHIATTESLPMLLEELDLRGDRGIPRLNVGQPEEIPSIDKGFVQDFEAVNNDDYELYARAQAMLTR